MEWSSFTARQEPHRHQRPIQEDSLAHYQPNVESEIDTTYLHNAPLGLNLGVGDLAVVHDNGIATRAARVCVRPANALGELGLGVGKEQLGRPSSQINMW
jgi:hypothetical protein